MGLTESHIIRRGLSIFKQPLSKGKGSPNWYARVYMPFGGRENHVESTKTSDKRQAVKYAETYWAECQLWKAGGPDSMPASLRKRVDPAKRFDRIAEDWLDQMKLDAGSDEVRLRDWRDKNQTYSAVNGLARIIHRGLTEGLAGVA